MTGDAPAQRGAGHGTKQGWGSPPTRWTCPRPQRPGPVLDQSGRRPCRGGAGWRSAAFSRRPEAVGSAGSGSRRRDPPRRDGRRTLANAAAVPDADWHGARPPDRRHGRAPTAWSPRRAAARVKNVAGYDPGKLVVGPSAPAVVTEAYQAPPPPEVRRWVTVDAGTARAHESPTRSSTQQAVPWAVEPRRPHVGAPRRPADGRRPGARRAGPARGDEAAVTEGRARRPGSLPLDAGETRAKVTSPCPGL